MFVSLSGNNIFRIEVADNIQAVLFLSSKKSGAKGCNNSTLKYPGLFDPFDTQFNKILFPIWIFFFCFREEPQ